MVGNAKFRNTKHTYAAERLIVRLWNEDDGKGGQEKIRQGLEPHNERTVDEQDLTKATCKKRNVLEIAKNKKCRGEADSLELEGSGSSRKTENGKLLQNL